MNSTLKDIELDFFELKYFLEYIEKNPQDERLQQVASRALNNLAARVELLQDSFNKSYPQNNSTIIVADKIVSNKEAQAKSICTEAKDTSFTQTDSIRNEEVEVTAPLSGSLDLKIEDGNYTNETDGVPPPLPPINHKETKDTDTAVAYTPTEIGALYKALSLNDVFYYTRELYNGDSIAFKEAIRTIENLGSYNKAYQFVINEYQGDLESPAFLQFDEFLKNYYNI